MHNTEKITAARLIHLNSSLTFQHKKVIKYILTVQKAKVATAAHLSDQTCLYRQVTHVNLH